MFFGDGAVQAGHFNESINLAALWRLPVIFVCENNGFAEFTSRAEHSTVERVSDVVAPYGFERKTVEGSDVPAVIRSIRKLPEAGARRRGAVSARVPDVPPARPLRGRPGEVPRPRGRAGVGARDPIARLTERAVEGAGSRATKREIERDAREEIEAAVRFARDSPFPDPADRAELVYAK